jgi:hypothetical protein
MGVFSITSKDILIKNKFFNSKKTLEERINLNFDAISLFICICFCTKYRQLMIQRNVLAIETYWDNIEKMLWNRFELIMKLHNNSIRQLDVRKMSVDTRPHYVSLIIIFYVSLAIPSRLEGTLKQKFFKFNLAFLR